jgi:hypothetical protein
LRGPEANVCRVAPFLFSQYIARVLWRSSRESRCFPNVSISQYRAAVLFAQIKQQLSQLLLARKVTVSRNFDDRPYRGILRPPAVLMFYDFAPHGDGANNNNPIAHVLGRLVLRLLSVFKCVVA